MKIPGKAAPELLYQLALDFIKLSVTNKLRIGSEMNILKTLDVLNLSEEEAEKLVFAQAYRRGQLETLISKMYAAARHET